MKHFETIHSIFGDVDTFDETSAPDWLTGRKTVKGSTMDSRWFWEDRVLTLGVGGTVETDFHMVRRTR